MAELVARSEKYSVNNIIMDSQHKKLVSLINELYTSMREGKGKETLEHTFDELIKYTNFHFTSEEQLMSKANYADFVLHKQYHQKLTKQVKDLQVKFKANQNVLTRDVLNFLQSWLIDHIMKADKKYSGVIS